MSNKEIEKLSFEEALKELEDIVRKLEAGGLSLDASIENYKKGTELKTYCEKKLSEAKLNVEKIVTNAEGEIITEPMGA